MISDHYILKPYRENISKILDISEHMAACYGFEAKELLLIRLLTEEMISSVHKGLMLVPGELWFSSKDDMFTVTVSVSTDVFGISKEERKKLANSVNTQKRSGLFGLVQEFMDFISNADEEISLPGYVGTHYSDFSRTSSSTYLDGWQMDRRNWLETEQENSEQNLEINLLRGFADDIRVISKLKSLEMSVMKRIPGEFSLYYLSTKTL